jgi:hypothetical protein
LSLSHKYRYDGDKNSLSCSVTWLILSQYHVADIILSRLTLKSRRMPILWFTLLFKKKNQSWAWWCTPIITALRGLRQEDHKFKVNLGKGTALELKTVTHKNQNQMPKYSHRMPNQEKRKKKCWGHDLNGRAPA